jgi:hypothetical protein
MKVEIRIYQPKSPRNMRWEHGLDTGREFVSEIGLNLFSSLHDRIFFPRDHLSD